MTSLPSTTRALLKTATGKTSLSQIPIPKLRDQYILIRVIAVALNPTDWQTVDEKMKPGVTNTILGCDAAGIVVQVGKGVTKNFKVGDRIMGFSHGGNDVEPEDGVFSEYAVIKGDVAMHIPDKISFEEAASLPSALVTVGLGFYRHLGLSYPEFSSGSDKTNEKNGDGRAILIYGGSSATGTIAIQFAKLSGLTVITTASPHNFDLLKSLGANHILDYRDPDCGNKIKELTNNNLTLVFDTIANTSSAKICAAAMSSIPNTDSKKIYVNLMGIEFPRQDVENVFYLGYTASGEAFELEGEVWDAKPEDFEHAKKFLAYCEELLAARAVKGHPVRLLEGGLDGILGGMEEMKAGSISGVKLVARVGAA